jgi:DHA2 family multidrug resistance protein-like MFS transporter
MIATSRLLGQASGAALVAFCFTISTQHGEMLALGLGAAFAAVASIASFMRMFVRPTSQTAVPLAAPLKPWHPDCDDNR